MSDQMSGGHMCNQMMDHIEHPPLRMFWHLSLPTLSWTVNSSEGK